MNRYILGIDSGLTVTKAVVFDTNGRAMGSGSVHVPQANPHPRWVERDMDQLWSACQCAVREAIANAGIDGGAIAAVGVTAHGDGLYLVDGDGRPVRPAIISLDSRAHGIVDRWRAAGMLDRVLAVTGQYPFAAAPAPLLTWLKEHEPENLERARWVVPCKDWIKYRLTGEMATDPSEASCSFTDVQSQVYSGEAFRLFGLEEIAAKVAPVVGSAEVMGRVTREAAEATGLAAGTPVVSGAHDVDACAIGIGCIHPGQMALIAGTYSINEVISDRPAVGSRWACRSFVQPGRWMDMSISPASAANLEWYVRDLCPLEVEQASAAKRSPYAFVNNEVAAVLEDESSLLFLPFLFGSPHSDLASAAFLGLRGWHRRGHLLRAIFEGVCFNHRTHVDALRSAFAVSEGRLAGGGARSPLWSQMFADTLGMTIKVSAADETGALGTAILAGLGAGIYSSLDEAVDLTVRIVNLYEPNPVRQARLAENYEVYLSAVESLTPLWRRMDRA